MKIHGLTRKWAKDLGDKNNMSADTVLEILSLYLSRYSQRASALTATKRFVEDYSKGVNNAKS